MNESQVFISSIDNIVKDYITTGVLRQSEELLQLPSVAMSLTWVTVRCMFSRPNTSWPHRDISLWFQSIDKASSDDLFLSIWPVRTQSDLRTRVSRAHDLWDFANRIDRVMFLQKVLKSLRGNFDYITVLNIARWSLLLDFCGYDWFDRWVSIGAFDDGIEHFIDVAKSMDGIVKSKPLSYKGYMYDAEITSLAGYRGVESGFDLLGECKKIVAPGKTHLWSEKLFDNFVQDNITAPYDAVDYIGFEDWVKTGDWITAGSSSQGILYLECGGESFKIKARKNMVPDVIDLKTLAAEAWLSICQYNTAIIKAGARPRLAVAGDLETYLQMSYVKHLMGNAYLQLPGNTLEEGIRVETDRISDMLHLTHDKVSLPFDFSQFDHQLHTTEIKSFARAYCGMARRNVPVMFRPEFDVFCNRIVSGFDNAVLHCPAQPGSSKKRYWYIGSVPASGKSTFAVGRDDCVDGDIVLKTSVHPELYGRCPDSIDHSEWTKRRYYIFRDHYLRHGKTILYAEHPSRFPDEEGCVVKCIDYKDWIVQYNQRVDLHEIKGSINWFHEWQLLGGADYRSFGSLISERIITEGSQATDFPVRHSLMSGLRWTSMIGNNFNYIVLLILIKLCRSLKISTSGLVFYIRGDDTAIFIDSEVSGCLMAHLYKVLGIETVIGKYGLWQGTSEFLRVRYEHDGAHGYAARAAMSQVQRKPWTSSGWDSTSSIRQLWESYATLTRRGLACRELWNSISYCYSRHLKIPLWLIGTPVSLGGLGIGPWDGESAVRDPIPRFELPTMKFVNQRSFRMDKWLSRAKTLSLPITPDQAKRISQRELAATIASDEVRGISSKVMAQWRKHVRRPYRKCIYKHYDVTTVSIPNYLTSRNNYSYLRNHLKLQAGSYGFLSHRLNDINDVSVILRETGGSLKAWIKNNDYALFRFITKGGHMSDRLDWALGRFSINTQLMNSAVNDLLVLSCAASVQKLPYAGRCRIVAANRVAEKLSEQLSNVPLIANCWGKR